MRAPTEDLGFRQFLLRVTLAKIDFWSEVLPQCILQLFSKKTFSSPGLRLTGFLSYLGSSSTFITLIAHIILKSCYCPFGWASLYTFIAGILVLLYPSYPAYTSASLRLSSMIPCSNHSSTNFFR